MDYEIFPLFPSVIYKHPLAFELTQSELNAIYSTEVGFGVQGNGGSFDVLLLNNPVFSRLRKICLEHAQIYYTEVMKYNHKLHMTNSWLNVTQENQAHHVHNHNNSVLSGVLYIKTNDSTPSITFSRITPPLLLNVKAEEYNFFNSLEWELPVEDNCIIIFPSQYFHYVKKNITSSERISIAFNTFVNFSWEFDESTTSDLV
jgi:uncharacterized protein (TIGR02466 family)